MGIWVQGRNQVSFPKGNRERLHSEGIWYYKGHMDKIKAEDGGGGGRWVRLGWGGGMGRKGIQL